MRQLPLNIHLDKTATFNNFYSNSNKQLLHLLQNISQQNHNFFYVWGGNGMGKSHLAQALCHDAASNNQSAVYYPLSLAGLQPEALDGLEDIDVVCLDDIDFVVSNTDWAEAIFNLFNNLKANQKSLVVFSALSPKNINLSLADLRSRFMSMETYRIKPINEQQQIEFVQALASYRGFDISVDVAQFLVLRCTRSVLDLVSVIEKLDGQSLAHKRKITIPFVKDILDL